MKIQLLKTVPEIGTTGEIIEARDAYARNYLLPKGIGQIATGKVVAEQKKRLEQQSRQISQAAADIEQARKRLAGVTVRITQPANDHGTLFAAVHSEQIVAELNRQYHLRLNGLRTEPAHLKNVGSQQINLCWPGGATTKINILIAAAPTR